MSDIWKRDSWINPGIPYIFNRTIIEYDIQSAGLSLIKEFQLLPQNTIDKLDSIKVKEDRNKKIGLIEKKNKELVEKKKEAFQIVRREFLNANLLEDHNIISIKKDAIFTTREAIQVKFGNYIEFKKKNQYSSYLRVGKRKIELYYNSDKLDVKGISDELLETHADGMGKFLISFMKKMEVEPESSVLRFLRNTIDAYKSLSLPVDYYREFNTKSAFITKSGQEFMDYWEDDKENLDISYNYFILCNLSKILL